MKKRGKFSLLLWAALAVALLWLGFQASSGGDKGYARALYGDGNPLGGKGLHLLLERQGYKTLRLAGRNPTAPADASVWLILDPQTRFTVKEGKELLAWIEGGGVLIWAAYPGEPQKTLALQQGQSGGLRDLRRAARVGDEGTSPTLEDAYPPLTPLTLDQPTVYRTGVKKAQGSTGEIEVEAPYLEVAGTRYVTQIARVSHGKGYIFVLPDPLLFTNYGLSKPDNAVLATNLIRPLASGGTVVFDERQHGETTAGDIQPNLLYYLFRPPLRYAVLQLGVAALLFWVLAGRRLGAPVPLPAFGPVTRASQFAGAMGALFHRVNRPRAAAVITGENFRRRLAQRLGMSPNDSDVALAKRAHEISGLPLDLLDRLLLVSRAPSDNEAEVLRDVRAMEQVLRRLGVK